MVHDPAATKPVQPAHRRACRGVLAGTLGAGYLSRFAGIIPVLAIQGGGYVVAGLAMLRRRPQAAPLGHR
jgi:hypothetical protein